MSLTAGLPGRTARSVRSPFSRLVATAVAAGLLAGLALTAVQRVQVTPLIAQAETYEEAQGAAAAPLAAQAHEHAHEEQQAQHQQQQEQHQHAGWKPENGVERTLFTVLANATMGVGYGLLLCAAMLMRGARPSWRQGLLWSAAGYVVFFVAPSLGLPPELPGTLAAPVSARQAWWICTAFSTAVAIGALAWSRNVWFKVGAVALLLVPHLVGAPQPPVHSMAAPAELVGSFIIATALANAVFWLALGGLTGYFYKKFA